MRRVLITGMSGTGKSSALQQLRRRGFEVVDTDDPGWTTWSDAEGGYIWHKARMTNLLSRERTVTLYVSGTVSNQGRFYRCFDAIVLLSAPLSVLLERIESRTTNDYGKARDERELIVRQVTEIEPLLRVTCTHEIDSTQPLNRVVAALAAIGVSS